jgi:hypothetical protein
MPEDGLFVRANVYTITAPEEQAICAYWIGKPRESFVIFHRLLARDDLDDSARQRIVTNRDFGVPAMLEATRTYPEELAQSLASRAPDTDVTVIVTADPDDCSTTEITLNSLLHSCTDLHRARRFLLVDTGLSESDRTHLTDRYPFLELCPSPSSDPAEVYRVFDSRFWLDLGTGWQFFAPEQLIGRLTAILEAESDVYQVGINLNDATKPANASAPQSGVRSNPGTGRYVLTDAPANGPAMYDTCRYDPTQATRYGTATLAEVIATKTTDSPAGL